MTVDLQELKVKTGTKRVKPVLRDGLLCKSIKSSLSEGGKTSGTRTGKQGGHVFRHMTVNI